MDLHSNATHTHIRVYLAFVNVFFHPQQGSSARSMSKAAEQEDTKSISAWRTPRIVSGEWGSNPLRFWDENTLRSSNLEIGDATRKLEMVFMTTGDDFPMKTGDAAPGCRAPGAGVAPFPVPLVIHINHVSDPLHETLISYWTSKSIFGSLVGCI